MRRARTLLLFLLLALPRARAADAPQVAPGWSAERWTTADGLPVDGVSALARTPDGFLWAATYDGLVRFDGVRFTVVDTSTHPALPSNRFTALAVAPDGRLFAATESRELVSLLDGELTHHRVGEALPARVYSLSADAESVWLGTPRGLVRYAGGRLEPVAPGALTDGVMSVARAPDGALWIGTEGAGLKRLEGETLRTIAPLPGHNVHGLAFAPDGRLWIGTNLGLFSFQNGHLSETESPVGAAAVYGLATDARGRVWAGTSHGTWRIEGDTVASVGPAIDDTVMGPRHAVGPRGEDVVRTAREIRVDGVPALVAPGALTAHLVDPEGGIWVGTMSGLLRLRRDALGVLDREAPPARAYGVFESREGDLWVGTQDQGLLRYRDGRRIARYGPEQGLPADHAWSVAEAPDGTIWVASFGLARLEGDRLVAEGEADGIEKIQVRAVRFDRQGRMWVGTDQGLYLRDGGRFVRQDERLGLPDAAVRVIHVDRAGVLWLGTNGGGLVRVEDGRARALDVRAGMPSDLVRAIHEDDDGSLWIATEDHGIYRLVAEGDGFRAKAVTEADGLYDDGVHRILADGRGRFWMSTNRGLFWVTRQDLVDFVEGRRRDVRSVSYTERDGMPHREANGGVQWAGIRARDGRLYFPTQGGVAVVDADRIEADPVPPVVHVEAVERGEGDRDVSFVYTAISFDDPKRVRFRYRLEGYDQGWIEAGDRRRATYTKVPPGEYRFRVVAANADHTWNEEGASVPLTVAPTLFETWWFRAALVLLGVAAVAGLFRLRTARIRARALALADTVARKTAELAAEKALAVEAREEIARQAAALRELDEVKTRFFAHINHELRTPLTLIAGPLDELLRDDAAGALRPSLEVMRRNAHRLRRLTDQILDLERASAGQVRADLRPTDLAALAERTLDAFRSASSRRRLALEADGPAVALADAELMETVLTNLLSNAVKFTDDGGRVEVRVARRGEAVELVVADDGVGIAEGDLPRVFDRFYRVESPGSRPREGTGLGLALVRELVALQGGRIEVESRLGEGTRFRVSLPAAAGDAAPSATGDRVRREAALLVEPAAADDADDGRPRVLVVDDNADLRRWVGEVLSTRYAIVYAADGDAGLAVARAALPDLVVADVMMPGLDGFALSRALEADPDTGSIPVLLLTGRGGRESEIEGLRSGAVDYLTKPFDAEVLRARVEAIVGRRARLREALRAEVARALPAVAPEPEPPVAVAAPSELLDRARAFVAEHIDDETLDVPALARALGMSRATLARKLEAEGAPSAGDIIRTVRLERARELLLARAGNVSEVAFAVGYGSLAQFSRSFKAAFGCPPSALLNSLEPLRHMVPSD
jgi:signal transduction histidine kinase/ligand-binding sensor domain-containing protein/DNA-binding response OmpR family regulator